MRGWEITWRDGYVEGFSTAADSLGVVNEISDILVMNRPIEIKVVRR